MYVYTYEKIYIYIICISISLYRTVDNTDCSMFWIMINEAQISEKICFKWVAKCSNAYQKLVQKFDSEDRVCVCVCFVVVVFIYSFGTILQYMYIVFPQLMWEWIRNHS